MVVPQKKQNLGKTPARMLLALTKDRGGPQVRRRVAKTISTKNRNFARVIMTAVSHAQNFTIGSQRFFLARFILDKPNAWTPKVVRLLG
jgi:hypothetical protein